MAFAPGLLKVTRPAQRAALQAVNRSAARQQARKAATDFLQQQKRLNIGDVYLTQGRNGRRPPLPTPLEPQETWQQAFMPSSFGEAALEFGPDLALSGVASFMLPEDLIAETGRLMPALEEAGWGVGSSFLGRGAGAFLASRMGQSPRTGAMVGGMFLPIATNFAPRHYISQYEDSIRQKQAAMQAQSVNLDSQRIMDATAQMPGVSNEQMLLLQQMYGSM